MADEQKPLQLFCQELIWNDDTDQGNYFGIVFAHDDLEAERLIAAQMIVDDNENDTGTLLDAGCSTFAEYYRRHGTGGSWGDIGGTACPNCTSHGGKPHHAGVQIPFDGNLVVLNECGSCGYVWAPLGFGSLRSVLQEAARAELSGLDKLEEQSARGVIDCGQCEGTGTTQSVSNLEDEECPVCDGTGEIEAENG